jgi:hypothetical protein
MASDPMSTITRSIAASAAIAALSSDFKKTCRLAVLQKYEACLLSREDS